MPKLNWIQDQELELCVNFLLQKAKEAKSTAVSKFGKNVIDPFSAIFEISGFELDFDTWKKSETNRQAQKTLQNHIGDFHQNILGYVDGWENLKTGNVVDLVSPSRMVIAEIKNKYNTISGGKLADLYYSLSSLVMPKTSIYKGYIAYYVAIIPKDKNRYDKEFIPSDKSKGEKCERNEKIREIDGSSFYDFVTTEKNSLENLYDVLPDVILECSKGKYKIENTQKLKDFFNLAFDKAE